MIYIINGPNLNLLGTRQPHIYGSRTFEDYFAELQTAFPQVSLHYFQSNHEGALIDQLHEIGFSAQGVVLNAGAYTHTSPALADAVASITTPVVEVHISNIYARETFRRHSYIAPFAKGCIAGCGLTGYRLAVQYLLEL
ncbi:MAG: type II 3-dehydroquinate dehydratase [Sphingobacteriales bacterium]|nr:type II 3-dehydroquinate dehydratase [Sphingobacteriales bacterium]